MPSHPESNDAAAPTPAPSAAVSSQDRVVLLILWTIIFGVWSQFLIISPLLADIGLVFGAPEALLGWLITGYALATACCTLVWGPISDRVGRRRILLWGTALMSVCLFLHGFATSFVLLLACRVACGAAAGMCTVGAVAFIGDNFPRSRRGWATGWVLNGFAVGQVVGIPAGAYLAQLGDYRTPFLAYGVLMALACMMVASRLPQPDVPREAKSLGTIVRGFRSILAHPVLRPTTLLGVAILTGMGVFMPYFAVWMRTELGFSATEIGWVYSLGGAATVVAAPRVGRFSDRTGRRGVMLWGSLGVAACMLAAPLMRYWPAGVYPLFMALMVCVVTRASGYRALQTEVVEDNVRGQYLSLGNALEQAGYAVGAALSGLIYAGLGFTAMTVAAAATSLYIVRAVLGPLKDVDAARLE